MNALCADILSAPLLNNIYYFSHPFNLSYYCIYCYSYNYLKPKTKLFTFISISIVIVPLNLNNISHVVMVLGIGKRDPKGIYGDRFRIDEELVIKIVD